MDPTRTILIDRGGKETEYPIPDIKKGDRLPMVLIKNGRVTSDVPSRVFAMDHAEVAKRFWQVPVYREVDAFYI